MLGCKVILALCMSRQAKCCTCKYMNVSIANNWVLVKGRRYFSEIAFYIFQVICLREQAIARYEVRILFNLYTFFIKGFNIEFQGPALLQIKDMDLWGTSLLSASPFLIASIRAKWPATLKWSAWLTIFCILLGLLFYHNNGYFQTNTIRFSLDFLPLLFVLTALGIKDINPWLLRSLIGYAIFLNLLSFIIHFIYHP